MVDKLLQYDDLTEDDARRFDCGDCLSEQLCDVSGGDICAEFETYVPEDDNVK